MLNRRCAFYPAEVTRRHTREIGTEVEGGGLEIQALEEWGERLVSTDVVSR